MTFSEKEVEAVASEADLEKKPSENEEEEEEEDQIIDAIGIWGPWQRNHILVLSTVTLFSTVPSLIIKFMAAPTDYWCSIPEELTMDDSPLAFEDFGSPIAIETWRNMSSPLVEKGGKMMRDQCNIWNSSDFLQPLDNSTVKCSSWDHDKSEWHLTIMQQWDLVCNRAQYKNIAQTAYFAGMMCGIFLAGYLSDRFGRKATTIPLVLIMCVIGSILPFSPNVWFFLVFRFLHGFFKIGVFTLVIVWSMEVVGKKWKTYVGIGLEFPWVAAWLFLALLAYLVPNWKYLSWITSVPGLMYIFLYWYIPESPRWLLATGRVKQAEKVIRDIAKGNGKKLPDDWKLHAVSKDTSNSRKGNLLDVFKHKNMAIKALILYFNWFANSFIYYGLTLNTGDLGGSLLLNFTINGALEIPAHAISLYVLLKGGRKIPYFSMIFLAGIALFCTIIIPQGVFHNNWPIITLAMIGKLCITASFGVIYVYSAEIYPTPVRTIGIGSSSVFARIGGMVSPYVGSLDEVVDPTFPIAIFGLTGLIAAILALFLPETQTRKLPDTLEEGEAVKISIRDGLCKR